MSQPSTATKRPLGLTRQGLTRQGLTRRGLTRQGPLRAILVAAVVVPIAVMAALAWQAWRDAWSDATLALVRDAEVLAEYGFRVLEGHRVVADRVNDLLRGLSDQEIRDRERELHDQLRALIPDLPLVQTVAVLDRHGAILVTGNVYPVPREQRFNDREWMQALRLPDAPRLHISRIHIGRLDQNVFFGVSRRRSQTGNTPVPEDGFDGVINLAVDPQEVAAGFAELKTNPADRMSLLRVDGATLARQPLLTPGIAPEPRTSRWFLDAVAAGQARLVHRARSDVDGVDRLTAIEAVRGYPVYAAAARDSAAIITAWRHAVLRHIALGLPITLALAALAALALERARGAERAELALAAETRFRAVFESGAVGMTIFDVRSVSPVDVNDRQLELLGGSRAAWLDGTWNWRKATPLEYRAIDNRALQQARERGWWDPYEKEYQHADGSRIAVRLSSAPLAGQPGHIVIIIQDITDQRRAEAKRDLLMQEVEHRGRNMLTLVQAILHLGMGAARGEARAMAEAVEGRVAALARAHSLLDKHHWQAADLQTLIEDGLAAFVPGDGAGPRQVELAGPPVALPSDVVQPLSLALHELATNALKYGALSRAEGRLQVSWEIQEPGDRLVLRWRERGGPAIAAPPAREGFGSLMIRQTMEAQLGAGMTRRWHEDGLECEITIQVPAQPAVMPQRDIAGSHTHAG